MKSIIVYAFLFFAMLCWGCKKRPAQMYPATSKMDGSYLWVGTTAATGELTDSATFCRFSVKPLNVNTVVVEEDTLQYRSTDSAGIISYYHNYNPSSTVHNSNESWLYYNAADNSMQYVIRAKGVFYTYDKNVSNTQYQPNPALAGYLTHIAGAKIMSGRMSDSSAASSPTDTSYAVNATITLTIINDSTVSYDNDIFTSR